MLSIGLGLVTAQATVVLAAPTNTVAPVISGNTVVGQTLSTTNGTWTGAPTSYTYQWKRDGSNIGSATASTYLLDAADAGTTVTCEVTATNGAGSTAQVSNGLAITVFGEDYQIGSPVSYTTTGLTKTFTTNIAIPAGDRVVITTWFNTGAANIDSIADNSGDGVSWVATTQLNDANLGRLRMFTKKLTTPWTSGRTITVTYSTSTSAAKQINGIAFSGSGAIDKNLTGGGGTSTSPSIVLGTLASAPQKVVTFMMAQDSAGAVTQSAGYELISGQVNNSRIHQISAGVEATTTPSDPTHTLTNSANWAEQAMSFAAA